MLKKEWRKVFVPEVESDKTKVSEKRPKPKAPKTLGKPKAAVCPRKRRKGNTCGKVQVPKHSELFFSTKPPLKSPPRRQPVWSRPSGESVSKVQLCRSTVKLLSKQSASKVKLLSKQSASKVKLQGKPKLRPELRKKPKAKKPKSESACSLPKPRELAPRQRLRRSLVGDRSSSDLLRKGRSESHVAKKPKLLKEKKLGKWGTCTLYEKYDQGAIKQKLQQLQRQLYSTKTLVDSGNSTERTEAALTIQQWFRDRLLRRPAEKSSNEWGELELNEDSLLSSDLVEEFRKILNQKHREIDSLFFANTQGLQAQLEDFRSVTDDGSSKPTDTLRSDHESLQRKIPSLRLDQIQHSESDEEVYEYDPSHSGDFISSFSEESSGQEIRRTHDMSSDSIKDGRSPSFLFESSQTLPLLSQSSSPKQPEDSESLGEQIDFESYSEGSQQEHTSVDTFLTDAICTHLSRLTFTVPEPRVNTSFAFVLCAVAQLEPTICRINPSPADDLGKLHLLQASPIGGLPKTPSLSLILPPALCSTLQHSLNPECSDSVEIYIRMLFDCINEALNDCLQPPPAPWCPTGRPQRRLTLQQQLNIWEQLRAGAIDQPLPSALLNSLREERMTALLCHDLVREEPQWVEYADEELQVTLDLADLVLDELLNELTLL